MYRFLLRPRWIVFHLLCLIGVVGMIGLGFWQKSRHDDRSAFNALVTSRADEPVATVTDVVGPPGAEADPRDVEWRPVTAAGTYRADEQVVIVNRSQNGQAGVNVVTPLELSDGRLLLVNRGFIPGQGTDPPPPPAGEVEVAGSLRRSQERAFGQISDPADGVLTEMQRIDVPRLAQQLPDPVVPVYLDLAVSTPEQGLPPIPVPPPELSDGPHLSYMGQWWFFSACVAVGWVVAVRRSIRTRRVSAATGAGADATAPRGTSSSSSD
jgi:cytochrome oxidase assembly protein ShyY1